MEQRIKATRLGALGTALRGGRGRMSFNDSTSPLNRVPHPYLSYSAPPQTGTALMGTFLQGPTRDGKVSTEVPSMVRPKRCPRVIKCFVCFGCIISLSADKFLSFLVGRFCDY